MGILDFRALTAGDFRLDEIIVLRQDWGSRTRYSYAAGRPDHGLIWVRAGEFRLMPRAGAPIVAGPGTLINTPRGAQYETAFADNTVDTLIHFQFSDESGAPAALSGAPVRLSAGGAGIGTLFDRAEHEFSAAHGRLRLKACLYTLLDAIAAQELPQMNRAYAQIAAGVALLDAHITENIPVAELARVSCVSERTFRRAFRACTGQSPVQYRNAIRLNRAQQLLRTGEFTVREVSDALGYTDCAYFCRTFAQQTGVQPGKWALCAPQAEAGIDGCKNGK